MYLSPGVQERWEKIPEDLRGPVLSCLTPGEKAEMLLLITMEDRIKEVLIPTLADRVKQTMALLLEEQTWEFVSLEDLSRQLRLSADQVKELMALPSEDLDTLMTDLSALSREWQRLQFRNEHLTEVQGNENLTEMLMHASPNQRAAALGLWSKEDTQTLPQAVLHNLLMNLLSESKEQGPDSPRRLSGQADLDIPDFLLKRLQKYTRISPDESKRAKAPEDDAERPTTSMDRHWRPPDVYVGGISKIEKGSRRREQQTQRLPDDWSQKLITMTSADWAKILMTLSPEDQARAQRWREERGHEQH